MLIRKAICSNRASQAQVLKHFLPTSVAKLEFDKRRVGL